MHVEPEFEAWMQRLVPGCDQHWVGASPGEIEALEKYASQPLPPFYKWFLAKMGRSMGPFDVPKRDMSVHTILSLYEEGYTTVNPNLFLIAVQFDEVMPTHVFYDLSRQTRNDAWVCRGTARGGCRFEEAETLRERLAWSGFIKFRRRECLHQSTGILRHGGRIIEILEPVLLALHFSKAIPAGPFHGIYDRPDVGLQISLTPSEERYPFMLFEMVGNDEAMIRSILGTISTETSVEIEIRDWDLPLRR